MMFIARTKNVQTKGRIMVKYGQPVAIANKNAAVETKNRIQYNALLAPLAIW
jgi:hypothetical protein